MKIIELNKVYSWQNGKYVILPNYYSNKPLLTSSWFKFSIVNLYNDPFTHSFIHSFTLSFMQKHSLTMDQAWGMSVRVTTKTQILSFWSTQPHGEDRQYRNMISAMLGGNSSEEEEDWTQLVSVRDNFLKKGCLLLFTIKIGILMETLAVVLRITAIFLPTMSICEWFCYTDSCMDKG